MIDIITTLGKVNALNTVPLSVAVTSLLFKPLNAAGSYPIINSPVDSLNTYIKDSDSMMAEPLNTL